MAEWRGALIEFFNQSPLRELSADLLRSIPGLPPILQTVHLSGVAVLMGTVVMLSLRLMSLVAKNQDPGEMAKRLYPWFLWTLPVMVISAAPFFLARPQRYLSNPVFDIKMLSLLFSLAVTFWLWRRSRSIASAAISGSLRTHALVVATGWIFTIMAGRWIAYADYIFWTG